MRIGIDIDGTITKAEIISDILNKEVEGGFKHEQLTQYSITDVLGISQQDVADMVVKYSYEFHINPKLNENSLDIMNEWSEKGYQLFIITARGKDQHQVTLDWLERVGVDYEELHVIGTHSKEHLVADLGLDIFIEDRRETLLRVEYTSPETINVLINTPYNQGSLSNNSKRVNDWKEIQKFVNQLGSGLVKQ